MLTIIIGKSASGKDTIQRELIESYNIQNIITTTTRPIREGEQDGKDYCFISTKMFEKAIEDNMFLEYRVYNTSVGNKHDLWYYGTPKQKLAIGKNYCIITDVQGAKANIDYYGKENCFVVFVHTTDKIRTNRAMQRGSFDICEWERRLKDDSIKFSSTHTDGLIDLTIENDGENNIADLAKTVYENIIIKQKMRVCQNRKER